MSVDKIMEMGCYKKQQNTNSSCSKAAVSFSKASAMLNFSLAFRAHTDTDRA